MSATPTQTAFNMNPSIVSSASSSSSILAPTAPGIIAAQKRSQAFVTQHAFNRRVVPVEVPAQVPAEGIAYNRRLLERRVLFLRAVKTQFNRHIEESWAERRELLGVVAQFRDDRAQGKPEGHENYIEARSAQEGLEDDIKWDQYIVGKLDEHTSSQATWLAEVSAGLTTSRKRLRTAEERKAARRDVDHASGQLPVGDSPYHGQARARTRRRRNTATAAPSPPTPTARGGRFDPLGRAERPAP